jgi:predicted PurR-regulated permease PerM
MPERSRAAALAHRDPSASGHGDQPATARSGRSAKGVTTALTVLAVCAAVYMLQFAAPVLLPAILAIFLFYALDPLVDWLEAVRLPRLLASVLVVLSLVMGVSAGGIALWPQIDAVLMQVPDGAQRLRETFRDLRDDRTDSPLERVERAAKAIDSAAAAASGPTTGTPPGVQRVQVERPWRVTDWLWNGGANALSLTGQVISVLFLTIFMLNEDDSFKRKIVHHTSTLGTRRVTVQILNDVARQIERFIWVQVLTSAAVAVATSLALWWLGVRQPMVWGLFAGLMNIVPYYGPLVVSTVLAAVGFLQFGTFTQAAWVGGIALAITSAEGLMLTPHLLSRAGSLNHVAIFLGIAFWSWIWGVPGMFLAVPMLMATKAVCDHVDGLRSIGELLGE